MKSLKSLSLVACIWLVIVAFAWQLTVVVSDSKTPESPIAANFAIQRYRLESTQSKFIAHAQRGGLLWFKGHNHLVAVREFTGEAQLIPDSISSASLEITAKTASMEESNSVFTEPQKKIINK